MKRTKTFWLATAAATVFAIAIVAALSFYFYELQKFGIVANNFPKAKLEAMLDRTGEKIASQCIVDGYRPMNNPFFGPHALAIDAPRGSWLVSFKFDSNGRAKHYSVLYSNVNSLMYHNKCVKK